ncbi:MAG: hypothetical protein ACM3PE_03115 [Deltaproteobacteria bacterium]
MSTRISDESLLLSKYLSNSSNKAAEVEKTTSSTASSNKTTSSAAGSKYDSLELSSLSDPYVYNNYNASGQYESMPSLIDYLNDGSNDSSSLFSSSSQSDALKLLGATGGANMSLVDYLGGGSGDNAADGYASYFSQLSEASSEKTSKLIEQAMEKLKEKEAKTVEVTES